MTFKKYLKYLRKTRFKTTILLESTKNAHFFVDILLFSNLQNQIKFLVKHKVENKSFYFINAYEF